MALDNKEVEIKVPVSETVFSSVKARLDGMARFVKSSSQVDEYFTPSFRNFVDRVYPFEWLSIRSRGGKTILNYKHYYPEGSEVNTYCDEFETLVSDASSLKRVFLSLGFKSLVTVVKERLVYVYRDDFEIALDKVDGLGFFIEVEALKDFGGVTKTRDLLFDFAKNLGIEVSVFDKRGYPFLLLQKKGLINKNLRD